LKWPAPPREHAARIRIAHSMKLGAWRHPEHAGALCAGPLRLSAGCEHPDDLWSDLPQALAP
jgi:cystathionine beta-lyase/cystathionine gamma-synthase